jgi:hypothetical protein
MFIFASAARAASPGISPKQPGAEPQTRGTATAAPSVMAPWCSHGALVYLVQSHRTSDRFALPDYCAAAVVMLLWL